MKPRRGVSLVELVMMLSATTVILSLGSVLIHRTLRTGSQSRAQLAVERTSLRLADQFRRDAHQALELSELPESAFVRFKSRGDEQILYRRESSGVVRLAIAGEKTTSRESFDLPGEFVPQVKHDDARRLVTLEIIERPPPPAKGKPSAVFAIPLQLQVHAALGRAAEFEDVETIGEDQP